MHEEQINVVINSPDKLIWEGRADSVSSENTKGVFDILAGHANFVTMIQDRPIVIRSGNEKKIFHYQNAVLTVQKRVVSIYADI